MDLNVVIWQHYFPTANGHKEGREMSEKERNNLEPFWKRKNYSHCVLSSK